MADKTWFQSRWRVVLTVGVTLVSLGLAVISPSTPAPSDGPFFPGTDVTYIVATNAGGGYDAYARHIAPYMQANLTADNIVVRNVPGAGHIVGANTLWRSKPDGLTIGTFTSGLVYGQLIGNEAQRFDLREFDWIGKAASEPRAIIVAENCPIKTFEDLANAAEPVKFAAPGIGSASYSDTMLLADALDLNVDIIAGFDGTEGEMSMMRGEICATLGSVSSFQTFVDAGNGSFLLTIGGDLEGVPRAIDFASDDHSRQLISIIDSLAQLGRATAAPPGTPARQLAELRSAYAASLDDPKLLAEAERLQWPIDPAGGEEVKQLFVEILDQSPETVEMIRSALNRGKE